MHTRTSKQVFALSALFVATLTACGGGSDGGTPPSPASTLTGTAATGAALANAAVAVSNAAGNSPCTEASITTSALGSYTCTLKSGEVAPFFIVVSDPTGNTAPLVSIATSTPVAGTPLLVNATPLTTAIVAQLNNGDALGVVSNKALYVPGSLAAIKANVVAQIKAAVTAIDPALSNYDPFSTSITAATAGSSGNTADQVLDVIKITKTATGALALATIADPTPVAVATATVTGAAIAAPTTKVSDLAQAMQVVGQAFKTCFAQEVSQRVTLDANYNITTVSPECQKITETSTGLPTYKQNGYNAAQSFYPLLTNAAMTGAKFSAPEIMAFYPGDTATRDKAVINIRFIDNAGNPGNRITVTQYLPSSSIPAHPSNWWVTGNQHDYDLSIASEIRRNQNFYPNRASRYQNGLRIFINGVNVGSASAPNSALYDSALVTGPGLPSLGLWYVRSTASGQFAITTVRSATPAPTATLEKSMVCADCSSFWMSRTMGLSGSAATTLDNNPSQAPYTYQWGSATDGSYNGSNGVRPTKGAVYVFKIYNNGALVATEKRTLLTDLVAATQEVNVPWNGIGPSTTSALEVTNTALNGTQTSLPVDWTQNPSAEPLKYIWVSQTNGGYNNGTAILPGATSVNATPYAGNGVATTFTSMVAPFSDNQAPFGGYREIGFNYRMLDGSSKQAVYTYYP
jgi:hypothetical protein